MDQKQDESRIKCPNCKAWVNLKGKEVVVYKHLGVSCAVAFDCPTCKEHVIKNLMAAYQEWEEYQKMRKKKREQLKRAILTVADFCSSVPDCSDCPFVASDFQGPRCMLKEGPHNWQCEDLDKILRLREEDENEPES